MDFQAFAEEFASILKDGPTVETLARLSIMVSSPEFLPLLTIRRKKMEFVARTLAILPQAAQLLCDFICKLQSCKYSGPVTKNLIDTAKGDLYSVLANTVTSSHVLQVQLMHHQLPRLIAIDLEQLQGVYMTCRESERVVTGAMTTVKNCTRSTSLLPELKEQVLKAIMMYVDPVVNKFCMSLTAMEFVETVDDQNQLHECLYEPEYFLSLSQLLKNIYYSEQDSIYRVHLEDSIMRTNAATLIVCFVVLGKSRHYKCRVLRILKENLNSLDLLQATRTADMTPACEHLIDSLALHCCDVCGGASDLIIRYNLRPSPRVISCLLARSYEAKNHCPVTFYLILNKVAIDTILQEDRGEVSVATRTMLVSLRVHGCVDCGGISYFFTKHDLDRWSRSHLASNAEHKEADQMVHPSSSNSCDLSELTGPVSQMRVSQSDVPDSRIHVETSDVTDVGSTFTEGHFASIPAHPIWKESSDLQTAVVPLSVPNFRRSASTTWREYQGDYLNAETRRNIETGHDSSISVEDRVKTKPTTPVHTSLSSVSDDESSILSASATFSRFSASSSGSSADSHISGTVQCQYFKDCGNFLAELGVSEQYIQKEYNRCFCDQCMGSRRDSQAYMRGDPPKVYVVPAGWAKFAIRTPVRATVLDIWQNWHVAYHGTRSDNVLDILATGELLKTGDINSKGEPISPPRGHFTHHRKPPNFDIKRFFLTPSIIYASMEVFSPRSVFTDPQTGKLHHCRVVFQARIKPGSYKVSHETLKAKARKIDPLIPNSDLEWSTDHRGVIILTGILVKLDPVQSDSDSHTVSPRQTVQMMSRTRKHLKRVNSCRAQ